MRRQHGFTFFEIIIVIAIMGLVYAVALPQLNVKTGTEVATKLGTFSTDIRSTFDMAVLHQKNYRLVVHMVSGDYWLETTESPHVLLGDEKLNHDPTAEEERNADETFDEDFKEYVTLAGQEIEDVENSRTIKPASPLLEAKEKLRPTKWTKVEDREWGARTLGPYLMVQSIQCEHHSELQTFENFEEKARAFIFVFPQGYIEPCVIHIAYRKKFGEVDETQAPYTVITNPTTGTADVETGFIEYEQAQFDGDKI